jgi:hypothetical protein
MAKRWDRFSDAVMQDLADEVDYARPGGIPRQPAMSALLLQTDRWRQIMRRMRQWGVARDTIGTEQPQPYLRPRMVGRGPARRMERWITAANQPDVQTVDPRTGRRVAVEVDTDPTELRRKMALLPQVNPHVRAAFELIDRNTGRPIETHAWNPLTQTFSMHAGGVQRRDVLDFEW